MGLWGKHKTKPYKNITTKLGSKSIATLMVSFLSRFCLDRCNEIYADNFACKYIQDKAPLEEVIQKSKNRINQLEMNSKQITTTFDNKIWKYIIAPFVIRTCNLWDIDLDRHP